MALTVARTVLHLCGSVLAAAGALAEVHYVDVNSTNATPPYMNWATAATNIQDAVDAAVAGDEVVVTDGVYGSGGRNGNRVLVDKPVSLRSVHGAEFTTIRGIRGRLFTTRCVYLVGGASLSGFTLSGGGSAYGGGAYGGTVNNCTLQENSATYYGGGAAYCTLNNCVLSGNSVSDSSLLHDVAGGGAAYCTLNNCTVTGNQAIPKSYSHCVYWCYSGGQPFCCRTETAYTSARGGGAYSCTLKNCIIYGNSDNVDGGNYYDSTLNYCCTTPIPAYGAGNITTDPVFAGNLRLQSNSPCINAGINASAVGDTDLDGNPRIVGGTVDIGAYEYQSPASMISYAWLQQYGLPIDPLTDAGDPDGDGVDNYHEWLAHSDPTNPFSFAPLLTMFRYGGNIVFTWPTNAFGFTLQSTTNLDSSALWNTNSPEPIVIGGQNVVISSTPGPWQFFRLKQGL